MKEILVGLRIAGDVPANIEHAGAEQVDLVRSGLDDTICKAYREVREIFHTRKNVPDLRTAAFVVAIQKIARTYMEMGL